MNGDLPGIDQKDVQIEFADQNTLVIRGRTVRESSSGTPPTAAAVEGSEKGKQIAESSNEAEASKDDTSRPSSPSSYHKATVEDEFVEVQSEKAPRSSDNGAATPSTSTVHNEVAKPSTPTEQVPTKNNESTGRYWVSERSVGEFHRSFNFPGLIDQDGVTASLKNGVLNVVVPKAAKKEPRRIVVE